MNLAGYVPLRRAVFEHTAAGKLSNTECLVFLLLVALADRRTGSGTINGPSLRAFLPELSHDAAKRVLCSLESKGYVFRDIVPFSKRVYRFWINKYRPTEGQYKLRQINISKALESRDVNDIEYVNPAPEGAPETAPEGAPEGALHYKKREERIEKRENPSIENEVCASVNDTVSGSLNATTERKAQRTLGAACALQGATHSALQCATHETTHDTTHDTTQTMHHGTTHVKDTPKPVPLSQLRTPEELGMFWSERDGAYREVVSGRLISRQEFQDRFAKGAAQ